MSSSQQELDAGVQPWEGSAAGSFTPNRFCAQGEQSERVQLIIKNIAELLMANKCMSTIAGHIIQPCSTQAAWLAQQLHCCSPAARTARPAQPTAAAEDCMGTCSSSCRQARAQGDHDQQHSRGDQRRRVGCHCAERCALCWHGVHSGCPAQLRWCVRLIPQACGLQRLNIIMHNVLWPQT